jgi:carbonic anhydrase/acetyltransferase-like protein (isoleucine patch superfamily)
MIIRPLNGITPKIGKNVFIAENAVIIGDVTIGDNCSIWYNVVIRGDVNSIIIGNNTNIQDGAILHCTYEYTKTIIGDNVTVGHGAIIHGCKIEDNVLIGMGSTIIDNAVVGSYCIVGANSLVLENQILEPGHLYAGSPAKKIKPITDKHKLIIDQSALHYIMYSDWYRKG